MERQNQNEALNGMFWERVPKGVFVGAEVLQLGIYDALAHFNIGCQASVMILEKLGISPGLYCLNEFSASFQSKLQGARNQQVSAEIALRQKEEKN